MYADISLAELLAHCGQLQLLLDHPSPSACFPPRVVCSPSQSFGNARHEFPVHVAKRRLGNPTFFLPDLAFLHVGRRSNEPGARQECALLPVEDVNAAAVASACERTISLQTAAVYDLQRLPVAARAPLQTLAALALA